MIARLAAASVAGGIAFFVLGFLIYGLVLDPMFLRPAMTPQAKAIMNEMPNFVPLVLSNIASALLFAVIFERWASIRTFTGGLKAGAIIMLLIALSFDLSMMAFMQIFTGYTPILIDIMGATLMGALGGGVIGMVLGMMNKEKAS